MNDFEVCHNYLERKLNEKAAAYFKSLVNTQDQRIGQAFMNALRAHHIGMYDFLTNTAEDPFYVNSQIPDAIQALETYARKGPI